MFKYIYIYIYQLPSASYIISFKNYNVYERGAE